MPVFIKQTFSVIDVGKFSIIITSPASVEDKTSP